MGRKAQPVNLLLLKNSKHLTKHEIEQRRKAELRLRPNSDNIRPPGWLRAEAKREFRRIVKEFEPIDILTNADIDMLAAYCDAYTDYQECSKQIERDGLVTEYTNKAGETNNVAHPLLTKKKQLFEQMKAVAAEFGLTPAARAKLALPQEEPKEETPFERVFKGV